MRAYFTRFRPEIYDMATARLSLKVPLLTAEVIEILLLYMCVTWTLNATSRRPPASPCTPALCGSHRPLVRQGHQDDGFLELRNDHPETAALLRWGNDSMKHGVIAQSDDICAESRWKKPGTRWTSEQLAQNPKKRSLCFSIPRRFNGIFPTATWS